MTPERGAMCVFGVFFTVLVGSLGSVADASFQVELLDRINAVEKQGQQQADKMHAMESRLEEQHTRLAAQERTIRDYKQRVGDLEHTVAVQDKTILDYKQRVADLEQTVTELKLKHDPHYAEDLVKSTFNVERSPNHGIIKPNRSVQPGFKYDSERRQRRALVNAEGPVAFHAIIGGGETLHLGVGQKLVFPTVRTNVGGGYRNQHGIFTAPQPGIYIFATSIMSDYRNHVEIQVDLMKNGQVLARAYAHGDSNRYDQGSVTVATQMAAGDEVWVSVHYPADTSLYGGYFDSFMGCLVYPL